mmetsp:Transcript_44106/g.93892  ORF Transcript_44106/g.93892 Transcript_44106/m.93892 type:complete len:216 (+) Transcript_44106:278-925(+)
MDARVIVKRLAAQLVEPSEYHVPVHLRRSFHLVAHRRAVVARLVRSANLTSFHISVTYVRGEEPDLARRIGADADAPVARLVEADVPEQIPPLAYRLKVARYVVGLRLKQQHPLLRLKQFVQRREVRYVVQHAAGQRCDVALLVEPVGIARVLHDDVVAAPPLGLFFHVRGAVPDDEVDPLVLPGVAPRQVFPRDVDHLLVQLHVIDGCDPRVFQ